MLPNNRSIATTIALWSILAICAFAADSPIKNNLIDSEKQQASKDLAASFESEFSDENVARVADPIKYWNIAWFHFNDKLYFWAVKPVAQGWRAIAPEFVRRRFQDFFVNLAFPARFLNTGLQGRPIHCGSELLRFITNTTVGIVGFWDPATKWLHLKLYKEDFDQTLGYWGIGMGFFVTWPFFGPSSLRGTFALPIDAYTISPAPGSSVLSQINNTSLNDNPYESLRGLAVDPYTSLRDAYVQNRKKAIEDVGK